MIRPATVFAAWLVHTAAARRPLGYLDPNNPTGILPNANGGGSISGIAQPTSSTFGGVFTDKSPGHTAGQVGQSDGKGSSSGKGDPILEGFDGRTFEFFGKVGGVYSLVSEAHHQLSMRLKFAQMWDHNGTYMEAFSLRYRGHEVLVELDAADALAVSLDSAPVALQPGQTETEELLGLAEGELHLHLQAHRQDVGNAVELTTEMLGLLIYVTPAGLRDEGGLEQPAYLNFDLQLLGHPHQGKMEGVVGHTYRPAAQRATDADDFEFHHSAEDFRMASFTDAGSAHVIYTSPQPVLSQA